MEFLKANLPGMLICLLIAVPSYIAGKFFPLAGGPVIAILLGMLVATVFVNQGRCAGGIKFTSKKVLQYAVILLGFGLDLGAVLKTGAWSLPVIVSTVSVSLLTAFILCKLMHIPARLAALIGVGSSICGGSAIAAAAPVIAARDEEIGQALSTVFFFNVLAALIFPHLGNFLGMSHDPHAFGLFAGTAVNDTSSVTAAAATWDGMWGLGTATLDEAVTVKLTRTLAIIPICIGLSFFFTDAKSAGAEVGGKRILSMVPSFIVLFIVASLITTLSVRVFNVEATLFKPLKEISVFLIVNAMAAVGINCNIVKLVKTGFKPVFLGLCCALLITLVCLGVMQLLEIW